MGGGGGSSISPTNPATLVCSPARPQFAGGADPIQREWGEGGSGVRVVGPVRGTGNAEEAQRPEQGASPRKGARQVRLWAHPDGTPTLNGRAGTGAGSPEAAVACSSCRGLRGMKCYMRVLLYYVVCCSHSSMR